MKLISGDSDRISNHISIRQPSIIPEIRYIKQNKLADLADHQIKKMSNELNKEVRASLLEDVNTNLSYEEFLHNVKKFDRERENIINDYFDTLDEKNTLKLNIFKFGKKEVIESTIKEKKEEIIQLTKSIGLTEEKQKRYDEIKDNLDKIQKEIKSIIEGNTSLENFLNSFSALLLDAGAKQRELQSILAPKIVDKFKEYFDKIELLFNETELIKQFFFSEEGKLFINNIINDKNKELEFWKTELSPFFAAIRK